MRAVKSIVERESLSSFASTSAFASPRSSASGLLDAGTLQILRAVASVLDRLYERPAASASLALNRLALCLESGATVGKDGSQALPP
jgi:hypothetical protein